MAGEATVAGPGGADGGAGAGPASVAGIVELSPALADGVAGGALTVFVPA